MPLDKGRAVEALSRLGDELNLTASQAALGVVQVANAHMERALRVISVERGHDPRDFTLLSFGGAGGLHAADLARGLGIPRVLVPPLASTLSAFGMLAADVVKDYTRTVMLPGDTSLSTLEGLFAPLSARGQREVEAEGVTAEHIHVERFIDMRYQGQSYELTVPFSERLAEDFHGLHNATYGYAREEASVDSGQPARPRGRQNRPARVVRTTAGRRERGSGVHRNAAGPVRRWRACNSFLSR